MAQLKSPDPRMFGAINVPAVLAVNIDPMARIVRVLYRGTLDLAPSTVDLPFAFVKQVGAAIASNEAHQEKGGLLVLRGQQRELRGPAAPG